MNLRLGSYRVQEDTLCLLAGQKRLKDEEKDHNLLPKINKSDVVGTIEAIEEYLRSCHCVITLFAYIIRKTIIVWT